MKSVTGSPKGHPYRSARRGQGATARAGLRPKYGARPLRRAVQRFIEDRLADLVLEGRVGQESRVLVSVRDENWFSPESNPPATVAAPRGREAERTAGSDRVG